MDLQRADPKFSQVPSHNASKRSLPGLPNTAKEESSKVGLIESEGLAICCWYICLDWDAQTERYTSTIALYSAGWSVFINVQSLFWVLTSLFVSSARHTCGPKIVSGTFLKTCQLMRDYQVVSVQNVACITMIRCKIVCNCKTIPQYRSS